MDQAHRGEAALKAGKYDEAISLYTEALKQSPSAATYYTKRSIAYQRTGKFQEALEDAELAVVAATARAKRELIAQAQLRRGIALYHLQKYGDALFLFGVAKKLDEKEKSIGMWEDKVKMSMKGLEGDDVRKEATVKEMPNVKLPEASATSKSAKTVDTASASSANAMSNGNASTAAAQPSAGVQTPASKIRHEWYQSNENVYITLLAKGVPKDQAMIEIEEQSISISFPLTNGSSYDFSLEPLFAPVDTASCTSKILSTKIELVLKKSTPGQKWAALEGSSSASTATQPSLAPEGAITQSAAATSSPPTAAPAYPTSSRTGPKNWDKIVDSYAKPPSASAKSSKGKGKEKATEVDDEGEERVEKDDAYVDYDDEGGDEVNSFFKKLYAGASDDVRKAMMKSYQESGGTALSTNWEEVKKAPVPITPPDGMEAKTWER